LPQPADHFNVPTSLCGTDNHQCRKRPRCTL